MENRPLSEQLSDIERELQEIKSMQSRSSMHDPVRRTIDQRNQTFSLQNFIRRAKHEYLWLGTKEDFAKEKKQAILLILASIALMVLTSVVATLCIGLYSTFTFFENLWLLMMLFVLKYTCVAKRHYLDFDYSSNSFLHFEMDGNGVWHDTVYKKRYKILLVLSCIGGLLNILYALLIEECLYPFWIILFELATLALNIFVVYKVTDFFAGYHAIMFTGRNDSGTNIVTIVYDPLDRKYYTDEDYFRLFPMLK